MGEIYNHSKSPLGFRLGKGTSSTLVQIKPGNNVLEDKVVKTLMSDPHFKVFEKDNKLVAKLEKAVVAEQKAGVKAQKKKPGPKPKAKQATQPGPQA